MASKSKLEDLNITQDEVKRIGEALKDENFRKMFQEYAEEISDPENRRRYEEEIAQMERERGMNVTFIRPEPGYVLKTSVDGDKKAFINISKSDKIDKPNAERKTSTDGKAGVMWHIPHSFAPPREDHDKQKNRCHVYDFVIHPDTYRMAEKNIRFQKLVEDTALDGIEKQFGVTLDRKNVKRPKMQFKGVPSATVIRTRSAAGSEPEPQADASGILKDMPYPYDSKTTQEKMKEREENNERTKKNKEERTAKKKQGENKSDQNATAPKYTIVHRSEIDMQEYRNARDAKPSTRPRELVIKIELPLLKSAAQANLDIFEKGLLLESSSPAAYHLDLALPYPVDEANGSAKFDKQKRTLMVTLPVIPEKPSTLPMVSNGVTHAEEECDSEKKLVEVISDSKQEDSSLPHEKHENGSSEPVNGTDSQSHSANGERTFNSVAYTLPEYTFTQDTETISFVLNVKNVAEESVKKTASVNEVSLLCTSCGDGGFPLHFALFLRFADGCQIVAEHSSVDITAENVVLLLLKERQCRGLWDSFWAGKDSISLEERQFLTPSNLQHQLMELDNGAALLEKMKPADPVAVSGTDGPSCDLEVTAMSEKKLTIKISQAKNRGGKRWKEDEEEEDDVDPPSSAEIQVVHTQPSPTLHSILKQRTVSESSEDFNLDPDSPRSPIDEEDELALSASGKRRSVSFNKHIDKATFKSSASVNSMKTALKSKRKRQRKWEEKKDKMSSRRRHNSTGSEGSGDDYSHSLSDSHSHSEEELLDEEGPVDLNGESEKPEIVGDDSRTKESENKPTLDAGVDSSMGSSNTRDNSTSYSSSDDLDSPPRDCESENKSSKQAKEGEISFDSSKGTSSMNPEFNANGDSPRDPSNTEPMKSDNSTTETQPEGSSSQDGKDEKKDLAEKIKSKLAEEVPEDQPVDSDDEEEGKGSEQSSATSTDYNEHRTECAFSFSNAVMFDLDVD